MWEVASVGLDLSTSDMDHLISFNYSISPTDKLDLDELSLNVSILHG